MIDTPLQLAVTLVVVDRIVPAMADIINEMFCVSYKIIRHLKECGGVSYPFDGYNFSFSFILDIGLRPELSSFVQLRQY